MDKNTLVGIFLIGAILLTFTLMNNEEEETQDDKAKTEEVVENVDLEKENKVSKIQDIEISDSTILATIPDTLKGDSLYAIQYLDSVKNYNKKVKEDTSYLVLKENYGIFAPSAEEKEAEYTTIENDKIIVRISSKGGRIVDVKLKEYQSYKDYEASGFTEDSIAPMQLFEEETSAFGLSLMTDATPVNTNNLNFIPQNTDSQIIVNENDSSSIIYRLSTDNPNKYIDFRYTLSHGSYGVNFDVEYVGLKNIDDINYDGIFLNWSMYGLSTEKLASDERTVATSMYRYFDEKRDYLSERGDGEESMESKVNWVGFKHKFFTSAIISQEGFNPGGSKVAQKQLEDENYTIAYKTRLKLPNRKLVQMQLFFGPNDYDVLASYDNGMEDIINHGWGIFGWVNKWFIQPIFNLLNGWGMAMGLIIFLVTLIVKIVITPLTYKNYISSAKMRVLRPEITKINERLTGQENMMKRNQETQELYRKSGVNPMAGCIPMLIQMPILLAVFRFFPSSIHLRHEKFLWAEDLSSFDAIASWAGEIPVLSSIYGNHISLFTLLMAVSTLIYTIMNSGNMAQPQQPGMPNMKYIMYFFPIMMIFFFNTYSSGLSYYYLCGNLFNIGIMYAIKKFFIDEDKIRIKIEDNKKKPKKKSKFMQRLEEAQKMQAAQQQAKNKK